MQQVFNFLANFGVTVTAAAGAAYIMFKFFGENWIKTKFNKELEEFKSNKTREIEKLKLDINMLLDYKVNLNQKEFETLPKLWKRLNDAFDSVHLTIHSMRSYPDLNAYTPNDLEQFLKNSILYDYQKKELNNTDDKTTRYIELIGHHEMDEAQKSYSRFHKYLKYTNIFLDNDLRKEFKVVDDFLWSVFSKYRISKKFKDTVEEIASSQKFREEVEPAKEKLENLINEKLHSLTLPE